VNDARANTATPLCLWNCYVAKETRNVVGIMSGTSIDAIDIAWVHFASQAPRPELRHFRTIPWSDFDRSLLMDLASGEADTEKVARGHWLVGHRIADAVAGCCEEWALRPDAIGCHGQTIAHFPIPVSGLPAATLQIGVPAPIALRLQCPVVHDFRSADVALGGQGAPLVPAVDALLFRSAQSDRILLNIGGVANATWLPRGQGTEGVTGFDTGPGNLLIDRAARRASHGAQSFDVNGDRGLRGRVDDNILNRLCGLPVLSTPPPRSFGREDFGDPLFQHLLAWRDWSGNPDDLLATLAAWTARATVESLRNWLPPGDSELLVAGGGAHNRAILRYLTQYWSTGRVGLQSELGVPVDAKEAYAFAVLADCTLRGIPTSLPAVTGARRSAILGSITFP